jgi:hypothetical protein
MFCEAAGTTDMEFDTGAWALTPSMCRCRELSLLNAKTKRVISPDIGDEKTPEVLLGQSLSPLQINEMKPATASKPPMSA